MALDRKGNAFSRQRLARRNVPIDAQVHVRFSRVSTVSDASQDLPGMYALPHLNLDTAFL